MKVEHICTRCGTIGEPKTVTPGYILLELILWCCWIVPGVFYSYWRHSARHKACKACGSREVVLLTSPMGQSLAKSLNQVFKP